MYKITGQENNEKLKKKNTVWMINISNTHKNSKNSVKSLVRGFFGYKIDH